MLMFFQKLISRIIYPFNLALLLVLLGLLFLSGRRRRGLGKWLTGVGIFLFLICSYWPFASWFAGTLESRYRPLNVAGSTLSISAPSLQLPQDILVLNGGAAFDRNYPPSSQLGESTIQRIIEGIRLQRLIPESTLYITSPQNRYNDEARRQIIEFCAGLGTNPDTIVIVPGAWSTAREAEMASSLFGTSKFILVTSALHMPRAMMLFEGRDLKPVPAPVDFNNLERSQTSLDLFMPTVRAATLTELAYHEYVGMLWALVSER